MQAIDTLPKFEACMQLYHRAYEMHGNEQFTADQIESEQFETTPDRLLDLAVAYRLIEYDGQAYRIDIDPDTSPDNWQKALEEHIKRILDAIEDADMDSSTRSHSVQELDETGKKYGSVFVSESDDFAAVIDAVENVVSSDRDGIVLRSSGDIANTVQRFADRLCTPSELSETSISSTFQKESSDVVGDHKNDLEFRLYLLED